MIAARTRRVIVGILALSVVFGGVGYSSFVFSEQASKEETVEPSPDNIRENFIFGDPAEDSNVFDTKYYTVNFYAQSCGVGASGAGPEKYYSVSGGNSLDGYSHYFGYFKDLNADRLADLGATFTELRDQTGSYVNCITFRNVSTLTQEILQLIGAPVCADQVVLDKAAGEGLVDENYWLIHFLSWILVHDGSSNVPDFYSGPRNWDGSRYIVQGAFPISGYEIPNFNLALENYESYAVDGVINFYPYMSTGKGYADLGNAKNAVAFSTTADNSSYSLPSVDFTYDPTHGIDQSGIEAYRLPGLSITNQDLFNSNDSKSVIKMDINRSVTGDSYLGAWMDLPNADASTYVDSSKDHTQDYGSSSADAVFNLSSLNLPVGRYNLYLFVKESTFSKDSDSELSPNNVDIVQFSTDDIDDVNKKLKETNIRQYRAYQLGYSFAYKLSQTGAWFWTENHLTADVRCFYLVIEKSFDVKLLGGEAGTWDYDAAPYSPSFNQIASDTGAILDDYEIRDVTMDSTKTTEYVLDGYGKIILPQTFFSIGIDQNRPRFNLNLVDLSYNTLSIGAGSTPNEADDKNVPIVTAKYSSFNGSTVVTEQRNEYYFSRSSDSKGDFNEAWSLITLSEWCDSDSNTASMEAQFIPNGSSQAISLAQAYKDDADLKRMIDQMPIFKVPATGEYNFYLRFHYVPESGVVEKLNIDLYFYRIHNIFVKIASSTDWVNGSGFINTDASDFTFYTSSQSYFLLDGLSLDDEFITENGLKTLGYIMNAKRQSLSSDEQASQAYVLHDVISGQYALPTTVKNGGFIVTKNHVLAWKKIAKNDVGWTAEDDALLNEYGDATS